MNLTPNYSASKKTVGITTTPKKTVGITTTPKKTVGITTLGVQHTHELLLMKDESDHKVTLDLFS